MVLMLRRNLDPLDLEILERAVQGVSDALKTCTTPVEFESDEELEVALRRELAEMVRASGARDSDALLDTLIDGMSEKLCRARLRIR